MLCCRTDMLAKIILRASPQYRKGAMALPPLYYSFSRGNVQGQAPECGHAYGGGHQQHQTRFSCATSCRYCIRNVQRSPTGHGFEPRRVHTRDCAAVQLPRQDQTRNTYYLSYARLNSYFRKCKSCLIKSRRDCSRQAPRQAPLHCARRSLIPNSIRRRLHSLWCSRVTR